MTMKLQRRTLTLGAIGTLVAAVIGVAGIGAAGIVGWEYSNSDEFCANMCHSVHPEETIAHKGGSHARVHCVECHMGRNSTLHLMALKPTHAKELWGMIVGHERPTVATTLRPSREACESCHWPAAEHDDSIMLKMHYGTDPASSETRTMLVLHTGFGVLREGSSKGVHWHIENDVRFVSLDPQRREIPWVEVRNADGSTVTYTDVDTRSTAAEIAAAEPRPMVCYDCHNNVGHVFANPEVAVDEAIAAGRIDRSLPGAKARAKAIIDAAGELSGERDKREAEIDRLIAEASAGAGTKPGDRQKEQQFNATMKDIMLASTFEADGITWKSFPDHTGHSETPGCFRCHDGKHFNEQGEAIRLQCTLCHGLPQVERENGRSSVASLVPGMEREQQPDGHGKPNFMHVHGDELGPECEKCHGAPLKFGRSGGNFCANAACHGRTWPGVNLAEAAKQLQGPEAAAEETPESSDFDF
jgi:NapC/NirT cytochrome c family, N-terminal region